MFVLLLFSVATARGQSNTNQPHIGYLYPAGARQGTTVRITAGGQFLRNSTKVYVSGEGVQAKVIKYCRPFRNLQGDQRKWLQARLKELRDERLTELSPKARRSALLAKGRAVRKGAAKPAPAKKTQPEAKKDEAEENKEVKMPDHPVLEDLDDKSIRELAHVQSLMFFPRTKLQMNRQLSEMVMIEVTVDADAAPGMRELRLGTNVALTNPVVFHVGQLPEVRELEPNDRKAYPPLPNMPKLVKIPSDKPLETPVLLNGQIMPGDVDRFRFRAKQGQRIVIETHARSLIPYLADAVPGWFQATVALYDAMGREVAFADDYHFNPDPVLFYRIPRSGDYELEIRDSIYRGREDFVYRIAIGEQPFITQTFPLGGKVGVNTVAAVAGWNLPEGRLTLDTQPGGDSIRRTTYHKGKQCSNSVPYAVDTLDECNETESNDTTGSAQHIDLPKIINGRMDKPGDVDVFRITGRAGERIVAEVYGRRLNSPLDSLLRLTDSSGKVLQLNDDYVLKEEHLHTNMMGLNTHHADSYIMAELPSSGTYYVHLADSQRHGGDAYGYRLRIAAAQGDFALRVAPSSISIRGASIVPISVHALRKDGYDGEIEVVLKNAPSGFKLEGGRIAPGRDSARMTLIAPSKPTPGPIPMQLEGRIRVAGKVITRTAVPADDVMQAFLYRHLVPAEEFVVMVQKSRWGAPQVELMGESPVRIPLGGSAEVTLKTRKTQTLKQLRLVLNKPPEGLTLHGLKVVPEGLKFKIKADEDTLKSGFADNLIVEVFREYNPKDKSGKTLPKRRSPMGFFPAIPIEVVEP
ncbi:MAG: PPC domain-containing protein [Planctomycetota bacterium]